jgi:hypothetical protein
MSCDSRSAKGVWTPRHDEIRDSLITAIKRANEIAEKEVFRGSLRVDIVRHSRTGGGVQNI